MRVGAPLTTLAGALALALAVQTNVGAQVNMRPEPPPLVTAENETWYLSGEAITYSGSIYFPAGPKVYFNPAEMVRSGDYRGIPLYTRTTIEPFSVVFVPVGGSLLQPYERRRAGDLAGTSGSVAPSFPVVLPDEEIAGRYDLRTFAQAAAPPTQLEPFVVPPYEPLTGTPPSAGAVPAPTAGAVEPDVPRGPLTTAREPEGLNRIFIVFRDRRWLSSGPAVELDAARFSRIGEYYGYPVYQADRDEETIYVVVGRQVENLVTPYTAARTRAYTHQNW